jgi:hypothetical protein
MLEAFSRRSAVNRAGFPLFRHIFPLLFGNRENALQGIGAERKNIIENPT